MDEICTYYFRCYPRSCHKGVVQKVIPNSVHDEWGLSSCKLGNKAFKLGVLKPLSPQLPQVPGLQSTFIYLFGAHSHSSHPLPAPLLTYLLIHMGIQMLRSLMSMKHLATLQSRGGCCSKCTCHFPASLWGSRQFRKSILRLLLQKGGAIFS